MIILMFNILKFDSLIAWSLLAEHMAQCHKKSFFRSELSNRNILAGHEFDWLKNVSVEFSHQRWRTRGKSETWQTLLVASMWLCCIALREANGGHTRFLPSLLNDANACKIKPLYWLIKLYCHFWIVTLFGHITTMTSFSSCVYVFVEYR